MPSKPEPTKPIMQVVEEVGLYPIEAYDFVQRGLAYTVRKLRGERAEGESAHNDPSRHISGQELSEGLREFALMHWGLLARTVLARWNIHRTEDFGRIVFAMVENGYLSKTEEDSIDDFRNVFDFRTAFEKDYRIECKHDLVGRPI